MTNLNPAQAELLGELTKKNPYQIVVRETKDDTEEKKEVYRKVNDDVDGLVAIGILVDVSDKVDLQQIPRPYRVIGLSLLGYEYMRKGVAKL